MAVPHQPSLDKIMGEWRTKEKAMPRQTRQHHVPVVLKLEPLNMDAAIGPKFIKIH